MELLWRIDAMLGVAKEGQDLTDKKKIEHLLPTQLPTRIWLTTNYWKILLELMTSMSSPLSPEVLTSSDNSLNTVVYADELAQIMEDPYSLALMVATFDNDPTGTAILWLFNFITDSMDRTRREMMRLCSEREEVFEYAIENNHFWRTMRPIVRNQRQNQCHYWASPTRKPINSVSYGEQKWTRNPTKPDRCGSTFCLTRHSSPSSWFHTTDKFQPGIWENDSKFPIHHTHSESSLNLIHCRVCDRYGHHSDRCIQMGALICLYCQEVGHGLMNCSVRRCDERRFHPEMQFCLICSQPGHLVDNCLALQYPSQ